MDQYEYMQCDNLYLNNQIPLKPLYDTDSLGTDLLTLFYLRKNIQRM